MKNNTKLLPYKVNFDPEYEQYNQRLARLPVPTEPVFQVSDQLLKLVENAREKIRDQDLEFFSENFYSQYATVNELNTGKKNASDTCPSCMEEAKKHVQCQFCAVMYCKNCCWRKRVLPNCSEPKDAKMECEICHAKFVRLFANQKFYQESTVIQKIIDNSNTKLKKLQKDMKGKKERVDAVDKKKKECKIREGILLRDLKNEEKKVQQLQQKLQEVVSKKAQKLRKQQQDAENEKKKMELEQSEKRKHQQELQKAIRKQKELQEEKEALRKKQEEMQRQLKQQMERIELEQKKEKQKEELRKKQQERLAQEAKKQQGSRLKRMESDDRHRKETEELRNLAKQIIKEPEHLDEEQKAEGPPIVIAVSSTPEKYQPQPQPILMSSPAPKVDSSVNDSASLHVNSSPQQNSPLLSVLTSFNVASQQPVAKQNPKSNGWQQTPKQPQRKSFNANNDKEKGQRQKTEGTQTTQREVYHQDQAKKQQNNPSDFESLPPIAINVAEMTVNQLLGIHINPNSNQAQQNQARRMSQRQSYLKSESLKNMETIPIEPEPEPEVKEITEEQKYEILRSSNMSASLLHSNHQEEEMHEQPDPMGSKCNCNLM